ncbi:MAG: hypothetical protein QXM31_02565 [Candidatus Woesearchaeota archaeon]
MDKKAFVAVAIFILVAVIALASIILVFITKGAVTGYARATSCIDSDNGKNYKSRGLVSAGLYAAEDTCLRFPTLSYPGPNLVKEGVYLAEGYCQNGNEVKFDIHTCPNRCLNGVCV